MFFIFAVGWIVINRARFGRYVYAIGGNQEATRLSGINVHKNLIIAYMAAGMLSAIAGLIFLSRLGSGQPSAGEDFAFDVITAVVLGGISITGGEGKYSGIIFGVIILGVLNNGLILMNVYDYYQMVIKCIVLILAVTFDQYAKQHSVPKKN
jgi:ribose transport system permease protein